MTELFLELANVLIAYIPGPVFRLFPMWKTRDVTTRAIAVVYCCFTLYICAGFLIVKQFWPVDFQVLQIFKASLSLPLMIIPFWIFRKRVWQNIFLLSVSFMYGPISIGMGMYAGQNWLQSAAHPLLTANIASLAIMAFTLPPLLLILRRLYENPNMKRSALWRFIWLLPALYFAMFLLIGNPFVAGYLRRNVSFIMVRVLVYCALLLTCYLLETAMRQASDNVTLKEYARAIENQLAIQREHYGRLMRNAETVKFMRHDMRHHLTLMGELATGVSKLEEYIRSLSEKLSYAQEKFYCTNYAVNAVTAHYLGMAENEGASVEARLEIPEDTGLIPAMDLCVIIGNLLENAVEACRRVKNGNKFIRVRARIEGDSLSIVVINSFDGLWRECGKDGVYLSRKINEGESPREGVGLSSVKAVCGKHRGFAQYEIAGDVWESSALVHME